MRFWKGLFDELGKIMITTSCFSENQFNNPTKNRMSYDNDPFG